MEDLKNRLDTVIRELQKMEYKTTDLLIEARAIKEEMEKQEVQ
ncbi:hypothetical protein [Thalassobacillus sp. C254]|nr:hypothetical protein [Thalassobacillus sp. C254]